ncbi:uncharacterized protein UV8b_03446 [Ustilaginoidea virens]|uniref:Uncharacterized protein n=1 Tax=Ustilaginoidea virens TaxID=1159556 RepID=A0A8E5HPE0_USTVR|nr:uncharacterized protein UV8b_03446 [Ustilaginoidea virens]QUC19205.1 hypothetical protein UV8b_03446 [Ustilaginoidea virens]
MRGTCGVCAGQQMSCRRLASAARLREQEPAMQPACGLHHGLAEASLLPYCNAHERTLSARSDASGTPELPWHREGSRRRRQPREQDRFLFYPTSASISISTLGSLSLAEASFEPLPFARSTSPSSERSSTSRQYRDLTSHLLLAFPLRPATPTLDGKENMSPIASAPAGVELA